MKFSVLRLLLLLLFLLSQRGLQGQEIIASASQVMSEAETVSHNATGAAPFSINDAQLKSDAGIAVPTVSPKSAAEIIEEFNELSAKYKSEDLKAAEKVAEKVAEKAAEKATEETPDNIIKDTPEASSDEDLEAVIGDVEITLPEKPEVEELATAPESLYEKAAAMEPVLMVKGAPVDEMSDIDSIEKISGKLVPEKKPLGRRRSVYRWVLKSADGRRIPLKSNLKLLQEVKREKLLDGFVTITGKFVQSGFSGDLRYFIVESVTMIDELPKPNEKDGADDEQSADKAPEKSLATAKPVLQTTNTTIIKSAMEELEIVKTATATEKLKNEAH